MTPGEEIQTRRQAPMNLTELNAELTSLEMGDFSEADAIQISKIIESINLDDSGFVITYGAVEAPSADVSKLTAILEQSPVAKLSETILSIIERLHEANPKAMKKKHGLFSRFMGKDLEQRVMYLAARRSVDTLLVDAIEEARKIHPVVQDMDKIIRARDAEKTDQQVYIAAGRIFLRRNPSAGVPAKDELSFENNRARFIRRLENLAAADSANEMGAIQMRMARQNALNMLDRLHELNQTLVPIWKQSTLALVNAINGDNEIIAAANEAHDALVTGLANSMGYQRKKN